MKCLFNICLAAATGLFILSGCSRNNNNYATGDDKTTGITNLRHWKGAIHGYSKGDTLLSSTSTAKTEWPKSITRTVDTSEAVVKINEKTVSINGIQMNFQLASSSTNYVFDTISQGTPSRTSLTWYKAQDSMVFIYHAVSGQNPSTGLYYYHDDTLHTVK